MANVESLIVELDAKIDGYVDAMNKAKQKNDDFGGSSKEMAKSVVSAGVKVNGAVFAMSAALNAMVLGAAKNRKELELMAAQAKTSADDFQALSFATQKYGINAEQIADISKDVSDKISEFAIAGTGAFQDYADSVGLTKKAAREAADEFRTMSSEEVLGEMVSQMEAAGLSTSDMTFAMESMGSDLSKLIPLFTNGAKELNSLKKGFNDLNGSMQISNEQAKELAKVGQAYKGLTTSIGVATTAISATLAPMMDEFFNDVIKIVPTATQALINFINTAKSADDINKISDVNEQIQTSTANILNLQIKLRKEQKIYNQTKDELSDGSYLEIIEKEIQAEQTRTEELNAQLKILEDKKALDDAKVLTGGTISATGGTDTGNKADDTAALSALDERLKLFEQTQGDELELLKFRNEQEKELIEKNVEDKAEQKEKLLALEAEYLDKLASMGMTEEEAILEKYEEEIRLNKEKLDRKLIDEEEFTKRVADINKKAKKDLSAVETKKEKSDNVLRDKGLKNGISALETLGKKSEKAAKAAFYIKKMQNLSEAYTGTAKNIVDAGTNIPLAVGMAVSGAAQIAAIASTSFGGGSSGGGAPSAAGGGANIQNPPLQDFEAETSGLELTDSTSSGAQTMRIEFINSTGDDIINSIAEGLNTAQREGRTS